MYIYFIFVVISANLSKHYVNEFYNLVSWESQQSDYKNRNQRQ